MNQSCWTHRAESGFLLSPDPIEDLAEVDQPLDRAVVEELLSIARSIPRRIQEATIRRDFGALGRFDMTPVCEATDFRIAERLFQIYSHFANAFVWCDQENPSDYIPASVAAPLVQLADMVERPPIMPYASTALANFQRIDPDGGYEVENLRCVQRMIATEDERDGG
ncbi:MAG: hypothetical protein AAF360_19230 [Pseudomonadota bacterium]